MAEDESGSPKSKLTPFDEAMEALSALITKRSRADKSNKGERFDLLFDYLKILELDHAISQMKIIHVAGTKGKFPLVWGPTCTFTESILRNCGFRTGLFTSPHLIDVRERFRLNGRNLLKIFQCPLTFAFLHYLPSRYLQQSSRRGLPFQIQTPIVCAVSSLGYDHMEILGNTFEEIAGEKAGIFKYGVPAFTVPQPDEAMHVLEEKASKLEVPLKVAQPSDSNLLNGLKLGLEGEHQFVNAGLPVALCLKWLERTGHLEPSYMETTCSLPEQFIKGLTTACLQGRAQIVPDRCINPESDGDLVFYLDGAHSPESMEVCAEWFSLAIRDENQQHILNSPMPVLVEKHCNRSMKNFTQILLFNCMSVRDPQVLFPRLMKTCARNGVYFKKALFVPNTSVYCKVGSLAADPQVDFSFQFRLQRLWENILLDNRGGEANSMDAVCEEVKDDLANAVITCENSAVFPSLPLATKWLRDSVHHNQSVRIQVLVTGSLLLVGDVLRLLKK